MKAICVIPGERDSIHLKDVPKPEINDDDNVLVKVLYAGVCGTDLEINDGLYGEVPEGSDYLIAGHESLGVVESIGEKAALRSGIGIGDYVARTVRRPCPSCVNCDNGDNDMCITGDFTEAGIKGLHGVMAEYYVDDPQYLVKVPNDHREVGVLTEPLAVVLKGSRQAYDIQLARLRWEPERALVIGAGPIGLLQAMELRITGLETYVVARSKRNLKSQLVEEIGAKYVSTQDISLQRLAEVIGNIDLIVDASGNSSMAFQAMEVLGNNGVLVRSSVTGGESKHIVSTAEINKAFVLGNKLEFGTVNANILDYRTAVSYFSKFEKLWPGLTQRLITRKVPVEDFRDAFVRERDDIKVVLEF